MLGIIECNIVLFWQEHKVISTGATLCLEHKICCVKIFSLQHVDRIKKLLDIELIPQRALNDCYSLRMDAQPSLTIECVWVCLKC